MGIKLNETEVIKNLKKIFSNKKTIELVNALTRVRKLGYYSYVGREIGYDPYKLSKIVGRFYNNNIEFTAVIDYSKIGLDILLVFVEKHIVKFHELPFIEWIKSYGLTKDIFGTYIQYYIPFEYSKELVHSILEELKKKVDQKHVYYYYFDTNIRRQPKLTLNIDRHPLITGYNFNKLKEMMEIFMENKYVIKTSTTEHSKPHDIIDLMLIKEFEKNAFTTIYDLADKLSIPVRILNRHLNNHVLRFSLIKGIYMKTGIFVRYFGDPLVIIVKAKNYNLYRALILLFENLENLIGISYSVNSNEEISRAKYVIQAIMFETLGRKDDIYYFLLSLLNDGYIEEIKTLRFILKSFRKFTIPYQNFLQEKRNWDLDTEKTHKLFKRRFIYKSPF